MINTSLKEIFKELPGTELYVPNLNGFELIPVCIKSFSDTRTFLLSGARENFQSDNRQALNIDIFLKNPPGSLTRNQLYTAEIIQLL